MELVADYLLGNDTPFWRAAVRAAAMLNDDPAPLMDLVDRHAPGADLKNSAAWNFEDRSELVSATLEMQ
jgi:hypothetical protein